MRAICLALCVLAVIVSAGCRPAAVPVPSTPPPSTGASVPLPTPIAPQVVPQATLDVPPGPVGTPRAASGIHLTATLSPTCPGPVRPGAVCTKPYQGLFIVTDKSGVEVSRATTDQTGKATIDLPPGDYTIAPLVEGTLPMAISTTVTVLSGQYVEVSVGLDSGIR